ncbi:hypothetical protein TB2_043644 [Malus domestica]
MGGLGVRRLDHFNNACLTKLGWKDSKDMLVWGPNTNGNFTNANFNSAVDWLNSLKHVDKEVPSDLSLCLLLCWQIWNDRNIMVFKNVFPIPARSKGQAVAGFVLRNHNRQIIGGEALNLDGATIYEAEAKALREDLLLLEGRATQRLWLKLLQELKDKALKRAKLTQGQVLQKIEERNAARKNKEYERSHTIRKDLAAVGIALMDGPDGTAWRPSYHIFTRVKNR